MIVLLLFCLVQLHCILSFQHLTGNRRDVRRVFRDFEAEFKRKYRGLEERERYRRFKARYNAVMQHNNAKDPPRYYTELNKFSDMDDAELSSYLGLGNVTRLVEGLEQGTWGLGEEYTLEKRGDEPTEVDHVAAGIVTPVKNQQKCGSCWAFAAVGSFESAYKQATGYLKSFAEQELLDCTYADTRDGCQGGWYFTAYSYLKTHQRLAKYNDLPYTAVDATCNATTLPDNAIKNLNVTGWVRVKANNAAVQTALSSHVVAVAVYATTMFSYRSGVFGGCPPAGYPADVNHAMLLTGYTQDYWSIKNSWGSDWGENGYIRLSRDISQDNCKVVAYPYYPVVVFEDHGETDEDDVHAEKDDENIAEGMPASQITTAYLGDPSHAVDGDGNGNYYDGSCSRTRIGYSNWWRVKLNKTSTIQKVEIYLRSDRVKSVGDIDGATIHVGDKGDFTDSQCGPRLDSASHDDYVLTQNCNKLVGEYVTIDWFNISKRKALTLCEVKVYAHEANDDCTHGNVKCSDGLCKPPSFC